MLDLKVHNKMSPKKGKVLITEPFLDDDYFGRSVILLCEHNEDGSFGLVLNKYIDISISELTNFPEFETKISVGGPVGNKHIYFIHTLGNEIEDSIHVIDDIYMSGNFEKIIDKAKLGLLKSNQIRFFLGYSGWITNQLEDELKQNSWLVSDIIDSAGIMDVNNHSIWKDYMKSQGGKYKAFSHFPKKPELN
jgi:putative transcriptional regulator